MKNDVESRAMAGWESIKDKRTPLTWGGIATVIGILWATNILNLIWIQGVNSALMSRADAGVAHEVIKEDAVDLFDDLKGYVEAFELAMNNKFDTDMMLRAKREQSQIEEAIKYDKSLSEDEKGFKQKRWDELQTLIECIRDKKDNCV